MDQHDNISAEDELKAENELLKLKLEMEHGMEPGESDLPPDVENQWLNHIYNFEQQWKDAKQKTVYEIIGSPAFKRIDELKEEQVEGELDRLLKLMAEKSVNLDMCAEYPASVIYKFITEEFFDHKTDDIQIPGMMHGFIYEEFHANHPYDLERHTRDYANDIFSNEWKKEYGLFTANETIIFNGKQLLKEELSEKVFNFQQLHENVELINFKITDLEFNLEEQKAFVKTELDITLKFAKGETKKLHQNAIFYYKDSDYWTLYKIDMEGLDL